MKYLIIIISVIIASLNLEAQGEVAVKYHKTSSDDDHVYVTYYYENGQVAETGRFLNNKRDGEWITYDRLGNKRTKGYFKDNQKTGNWTAWSINGEIIGKMVYSQNKLQSITYNPSVEKTAYINK